MVETIHEAARSNDYIEKLTDLLHGGANVAAVDVRILSLCKSLQCK
jgi:hypothetical protein